MAESHAPYTSSQKSIHRIPETLRKLDPNAYEPSVVSIGPYHHDKAELQAMEGHKQRVFYEFINVIDDRCGINRSYEILAAEFERKDPNFLEEVRKCYTEPLKDKWSSNKDFFRLMVLDGYFLLWLLFEASHENPALLSYVKMDMLVLDNQIPLLFLRDLASIIAKLVSDRPSATPPTGSEIIVIPVEDLNITELMWKFYGTNRTMNDEIGCRGKAGRIPDDAHHVLDAYRKGCISTGDYDGWVSRRSARELYFYGVEFRASRGGGLADGFVGRGSFKNVVFKDSDLFNICKQQTHENGQAQSGMIRTFWWFIRLILIITFWWWYIPFRAAKGMFFLPQLSIDGTTRPILLNIMDFERLYLRFEGTHPVTDYVSLMGSLIRSENDVEHLRKKSILSCSPGWTDESVVKLFSDLTRNVVFKGTRKTNPEIDALCERPLNKFGSFWRRVASSESSDVKSLCLLLLTLYGLAITAEMTRYCLCNVRETYRKLHFVLGMAIRIDLISFELN